MPKQRRSDYDVIERQCSRCHEWWPATKEFFYSSGPFSSGLHSMCRACYLERLAARRAARKAANTPEWPIQSWGKQKVCSFCPGIITARYDQLGDFGWFAFVPTKGGDRQRVIIGCPEHRKIAEQVSLLWLRFMQSWGTWPSFRSYMEEHGFTLLMSEGRGEQYVGAPQLFFRREGDKEHGTRER